MWGLVFTAPSNLVDDLTYLVKTVTKPKMESLDQIDVNTNNALFYLKTAFPGVVGVILAAIIGTLVRTGFGLFQRFNDIENRIKALETLIP